MNAESTAARSRFPSGLIQPAGSFRFSLDALLLASFTAGFFPDREKPVSLLDLGCGCGVIGLACLLERENAVARGVDREPELVDAAMANAALLGVERRYAAIRCELGDETERALFAREKVDAVIANMPYRPENSGRLPRSAMRRRALFADESTMPAFLEAAEAALKPDGIFTLVYPWREYEKLHAGLAAYGFYPAVALPVCTVGAEKTLCLVSAGRERRPGKTPARVLPPLVLREKAGGAYTSEALAFCRWL